MISQKKNQTNVAIIRVTMTSAFISYKWCFIHIYDLLDQLTQMEAIVSILFITRFLIYGRKYDIVALKI